jgi:ankyrin repeat protein
MADTKTWGRALYRAMKDGEDAEVKRLLASPDRMIDAPAGGPIALPLISAVLSERIDYLVAVLDAGAEVDVRELSPRSSTYRLRALEAALWSGEDEMVQLLLERGALPDFGTHVFRCDVPAVSKAIDADASLLEERFLRPTYTLLHVAADLSDAGLIKEFARRGVDPCEVDADGHAPLRLAARNEPALEALDALLDAGADVNAASKTGITALTAAVRFDECMPTVARLLERGADPSQAMKDGTTPLMKAASNRLPDAIRLLLKHGAVPLAKNKKGQTALDLAKKRRCAAAIELLQEAAR